MKVYSRKEFISYWNSIKPGLGLPGSGLWVYEVEYNFESQHFICCKSIAIPDGDEYTLWVSENCAGRVTCYSSNDKDEEWWGFTEHNDIIPWILRWI